MIRILSTLPLMLVIALLMGCGGGSSIPTTPGLDNLGASGGLGSVNGNSTDDDGTADQGKGDAPGTPGADDNGIGGDDDGTADQGGGNDDDGPNHDLNDDNGNDGPDHDLNDDHGNDNDDNGGGDDDGTPDQGSGDN